MYKNYLKIAWRNLSRNRSYTIINVAGLAVGASVCMMIFIIIKFHTSFDDYHPKKDRVYRVITRYKEAEAASIQYGKDVPFPLPMGLRTAFPQLEEVAPVWTSHNDQLHIPGENGSTIKTFK